MKVKRNMGNTRKITLGNFYRPRRAQTNAKHFTPTEIETVASFEVGTQARQAGGRYGMDIPTKKHVM